MKKVFLIPILFISLMFTAYSQVDYGIKGGVNYDFSGNIHDLGTNLQSSTDDIQHGSKSAVGYHMGVWLKAEYSNIFIRPELVYSQIKKDYNFIATETVETKKIDIPVVIGTKVLGPVYVFGGPAFQYILANDFSVTGSKIDTKDFTVGLNLGAGVEFGNFGLEVRWEKGMTQNDKANIMTNLGTGNFVIDNRPNQLIFSVNFKL